MPELQEDDLNSQATSRNNEYSLDGSSIASQFDDLSVIGDGAYGIVYKAKERHSGNYVALKRIKISCTEDGIPISAIREISALKYLRYLNNSNVVRLLDICQGRFQNNSVLLFLIFEHIDQNLSEYIEKNSPGFFDSDRIKDISRQLLNGIDFLHSHRIVHRDLKPQNILVTAGGQVKIADFGLAKIYDNDMRLTSLVQTLWYRAPEVILGLSYATPIDIWACGCIIAELFLRKPLFPGSSEIDQLNRIFQVIGTPREEDWSDSVSVLRSSFYNWPPISLRSVIPGITEPASDMLSKMFRFDASQRLKAQDSLQHEYFFN